MSSFEFEQVQTEQVSAALAAIAALDKLKEEEERTEERAMIENLASTVAFMYGLYRIS